MGIVCRYQKTFVYRNDELQSDDNIRGKFQSLPLELTRTAHIDNAYCIIQDMEVVRDQATFHLLVFDGEEKEVLLDRKRYSFNLDVQDANTPNFYVQAYEFIKTQPEFEGAVDI